MVHHPLAAVRPNVLDERRAQAPDTVAGGAGAPSAAHVDARCDARVPGAIEDKLALVVHLDLILEHETVDLRVPVREQVARVEVALEGAVEDVLLDLVERLRLREVAADRGARLAAPLRQVLQGVLDDAALVLVDLVRRHALALRGEEGLQLEVVEQEVEELHLQPGREELQLLLGAEDAAQRLVLDLERHRRAGVSSLHVSVGPGLRHDEEIEAAATVDLARHGLAADAPALLKHLERVAVPGRPREVQRRLVPAQRHRYRVHVVALVELELHLPR
mmetsp:Transcript_19285/g.58326  ORF Transcript_19285/g.58326 Transcript_19285/m.58326 type:complete len:277 (-) Transcript_19285:386-1216(-)